jgi:hypothetical protein
MGLDTVELVMEVEDAFGITIEDAEAEAVHTVNDLYHLVARKSGVVPQDRCLSARAFYRLRRAIRAISPAAPQRLRPSTTIDEDLPVRDRRKAWPRLAEATGLRLPRLEASAAVAGSLLAGTLVGAVALGVWVGWLTMAQVGLVVVFVALVVLGILSCLIARLVAKHMPSCRTLGELAHRILCRNYSTIARESGAGYDRELWAALCRIIGEAVGIDPRELRPEDDFLKDLS